MQHEMAGSRCLLITSTYRYHLRFSGWGGRIRTSVWRNQNPLPYHLATPHDSLARAELLFWRRFPRSGAGRLPIVVVFAPACPGSQAVSLASGKQVTYVDRALK